MKQSHAHITFLFVTLGIVAILLLLTDMATGDTFIPISKVWAVLTGGECDEMTRNILLSIRFVRVVVAGLIGIALSVSGLQMQTVFQNPLADPYLLGVSSGAGLGVALFILGAPLLGWTAFPLLQSIGIIGSGWIGTAVILLGVAVISRKVKNILGVLIMGVTAELAAAWRKLCTDDGNEYQTLTDTHFHIYRPTDGNSYRLLRSGWIYRIGRAAHHTIVIQQCRPSCARSGNNTYGTYRYAALRHYRQKIPASGQLYYRPVGSSGHFMGNC